MNGRDSDVVDVRDAEAQLLDLIALVEHGQEITLGQSGQPAAKLIPIPADFDPDSLGDLEGEIWMDPDLELADPLFFAAHRGPEAC